jgi:hypothetical protein
MSVTQVSGVTPFRLSTPRSTSSHTAAANSAAPSTRPSVPSAMNAVRRQTTQPISSAKPTSALAATSTCAASSQ